MLPMSQSAPFIFCCWGTTKEAETGVVNRYVVLANGLSRPLGPIKDSHPFIALVNDLWLLGLKKRTCVFELVENHHSHTCWYYGTTAQVGLILCFLFNIVCVCNLCLKGMSVLAKSFGASFGKSGFDSHSFSNSDLQARGCYTHNIYLKSKLSLS